MELETDFLSCTLQGSAPKSDLKDPRKIANKDQLQQVIQMIYSNLAEDTGRMKDPNSLPSFCIPLDELNCLCLSFKNLMEVARSPSID